VAGQVLHVLARHVLLQQVTHMIPRESSEQRWFQPKRPGWQFGEPHTRISSLLAKAGGVSMFCTQASGANPRLISWWMPPERLLLLLGTPALSAALSIAW